MEERPALLRALRNGAESDQPVLYRAGVVRFICHAIAEGDVEFYGRTGSFRQGHKRCRRYRVQGLFWLIIDMSVLVTDRLERKPPKRRQAGWHVSEPERESAL